jgi:hypothetical protein
MASKRRGRSAKQTLSRQRAETRRRAPGKKFIGETQAQSAAAREAERRKVERMAEVDAALRRADEIGVPIVAVAAELVQDAVRIATTLASAPFRLALALRTQSPASRTPA